MAKGVIFHVSAEVHEHEAVPLNDSKLQSMSDRYSSPITWIKLIAPTAVVSGDLENV
jgi:hypothetical protein